MKATKRRRISEAIANMPAPRTKAKTWSRTPGQTQPNMEKSNIRTGSPTISKFSPNSRKLIARRADAAPTQSHRREGTIQTA
ncbi:hypothetical protein GCM10007853_17770 [Algimonas ampicilliniresistens]|uniref:Uncharacterized protein n=1 Tax=Algimonas ampicilliniresistens TaxID=1298735 RepID=A0ABQ5VAS3_9PROT|nr:hypothetical protein GCM10007853_17770 [Algimonas ampicilliniresistens]